MKYNYIDNLRVNIFNKIKSWNDPYGIFRGSFCLNSSQNTMGWFISSIEMSSAPIGLLEDGEYKYSVGTSIHKEEAIIKSIGEGIERYCVMNHFLSNSVVYKNVDIKKEFVRCSEEESAPETFKNLYFKYKIQHTEVVKLIDGEIDYLPIESVYILPHINREFYTPGISTGTSFYPNKIKAIWSGICEVLERHSLMKFWYTYFEKVKKIDLLDFMYDMEVAERIRRIRSEEGLEVFLFEISQEINIPVVLCILRHKNHPFYSVGVSCNENVNRAITKSLDESISIRELSKKNGKKNVDTSSFYWIDRLEKHIELYANWNNSFIMEELINKKMEVLDISSKLVDDEFVDLKKDRDLRDLAFKFKEKGFDIYYKDITLNEISDMGFVYKVVIPQMIPLSQSYNHRWLGYLVDSGYEYSELNYFPQPFS